MRLALLQGLFQRLAFGLAERAFRRGGLATAAQQRVAELVAKRAGVATVIANPFASMQVSDRIRPRQLAQDAPMLTIAAGLAMRGFE